MRLVLLVAWLCCAPTFALYLLLRPSPRADELRVLPMGWLQWLDEHYNFRTFLLTLIVCLPVAWLLRARQFRNLRRSTLCGLLLVLAGAEVVQLWIPKRVFDWEDVGFTVLGVVVAEGCALVYGWGKETLRARRSQRRVFE